MEVIQREAIEYTRENGTSPFKEWFSSLKDPRSKAIVQKRIDRAEEGNFGEWNAIGNGAHEMKIHYGPGYRIYFALEGKNLILLLCGGDKSTQQKDIKTALLYWEDHKKRRQK